MAKEKFERNEPPVNVGTIDSADRGGATNMAAITKHATLNNSVANMSVDEIDKVLGIVFLNKCDMVRKLDNPFRIPVEDVFNISGHGFAAVGTIERGIVEITETGDAMRAGVEAFQKLIDEGQAGDNVGLSLRGTKIDQPDIASVSAFGWGVEMFMPGDNATINVELITPIEMEKELCFAIN